MFGGHAPPFGWYCSASRSRASAPSRDGELRHLAGRVRVVRRELADPLGLGVAASSGSEHDRAGVDDVVADPRAPASVGLDELTERRVGEARAGAGLPRLAQLLGDRVPGAVADLEQALRATSRRSARAGSRRSRGVNSTPSSSSQWIADWASPVSTSTRREVGRLVRGAPDVGSVLLGRVVRAERRLDAALRLRRVVRLQRALGRESDTGARAFSRDRGSKAGGPAADHEHVEGGDRRLHGRTIPDIS